MITMDIYFNLVRKWSSLKFFLVFLCFEAVAQPDATLLWTAEPQSDIQWMYPSATGVLVYATKDSTLTGIDPKSGATKWKLKAKALSSSVDVVEGFPYLQLRDVPLTIIDPVNGRFIINAATEHITTVYGYGFLHQSGHLWLDAEIDFGRGLSIFDMTTGKKLWTRYDYFGMPDQTEITRVRGLVDLGSKGGIRQTLLCAPVGIDKDYMLIASGDKTNYNDLYKVLIKTGEVIWKIPAPDPVKSELVKGDLSKVELSQPFFRLIKGHDNFFYIGSKSLMACSYDNGKSLWRTPLTTNSKIGGVIYDQHGLIFYSSSPDADSPYTNGRVFLVNDTTGLATWKDPLNIAGGISKYQYTSAGLAVVMENPQFALDPALEGSYLNFIDVGNGNYKLKESIRLPGRLMNLQTIDKGLYYSTDRTLNITDLEGKALFDIPSRGIIQGEDSVKAWFYTSGNFYEIDKGTASKRLVNKDAINFTPDHIEVKNDGVLLYSDQDITFINSDGSTRYQLHYRQISKEFESATLESLRKNAPARATVLGNHSQSSMLALERIENNRKLLIISIDTGKVISKIDMTGIDMPPFCIDGDTLFLKAGDSINAYTLR